MVWWYIAVFVVALVASYLLTPTVETPSKSPGEISVPVAEEDIPIPVLFGTRVIEQSNVVWYGDVNTKPIKSKGGKK